MPLFPKKSCLKKMKNLSQSSQLLTRLNPLLRVRKERERSQRVRRRRTQKRRTRRR
jgi:hypothetical protein